MFRLTPNHNQALVQNLYNTEDLQVFALYFSDISVIIIFLNIGYLTFCSIFDVCWTVHHCDNLRIKTN